MGDIVQMGIALHVLQDTFSHQGFSGWNEKLNSCYPWYNPACVLPNVGHAELQAMPDIANYTWTDPRNGETILNQERVIEALKVTTEFLCQYNNKGLSYKKDVINSGIDRMISILNKPEYDERKKGLISVRPKNSAFYSPRVRLG